MVPPIPNSVLSSLPFDKLPTLPTLDLRDAYLFVVAAALVRPHLHSEQTKSIHHSDSSPGRPRHIQEIRSPTLFLPPHSSASRRHPIRCLIVPSPILLVLPPRVLYRLLGVLHFGFDEYCSLPHLPVAPLGEVSWTHWGEVEQVLADLGYLEGEAAGDGAGAA